MQNDNFSKHLRKERTARRQLGRGGNLVLAGAFLVVIGVILMAKTAGVPFPKWFFTWPILLIGVGIYSAFQYRFRPGIWILFLLIGGVFLADRIVDTFYFKPYIWPAVFILVGIFIMLKPKNLGCRDNKNTDGNADESYNPPLLSDVVRAEPHNRDSSSVEILDVTAVLGGIKRNIINKNFKGGDIVTFMGGVELNLMQADFAGMPTIDCFNMFGGTKLIVPPDWDVQSHVVAIFGGVDDKRPPAPINNQSKVIYLEGTCIFGGIEIRSF